MFWILDALELKRRTFSCLFSSGQHGGQRKPADVIINGQLGGTKTARAASKVKYDGFLCASFVHVDKVGVYWEGVFDATIDMTVNRSARLP